MGSGYREERMRRSRRNVKEKIEEEDDDVSSPVVRCEECEQEVRWIDAVDPVIAHPKPHDQEDGECHVGRPVAG